MKCPKGHEGVIKVKGSTSLEGDHLKCVICGWTFRSGDETASLKQIKKEEIMADILKKCSKCHIEKPATEEFFYKDSKSKDGLGWWCRQCHKDRSHISKKENPRNINAKDKGFRKYKQRSAKRIGPNQNNSITKATPEEIIKALRRGAAQEILQEIGDVLSKVRERWV
jgi:hypothetical protein